MKNRMKKMLSVILALALVLTSVVLPGFSKTAGAAGDTFKFYFYYETESTLYMDIWSSTGIKFAEGTQTEDAFGWGKQEAVLQPVAGNAGWYSVDITVLDTAAGDGFDIYDGSADNKIGTGTYSQQYDHKEDYAVLVGGSKDAYAVKGGTLYTDLSEAGLTIGSNPEPGDSLDSLKTLVASVPEDYQTLGFAADSVAAVKQALETANALITANSSDASAIDAAYKALSDALDGLAFLADIFVQKVNNYDESSIRGMDVSSYLSIMKSFEKVKADKRAAGASEEEINKIGFKDWTGKVLDEQGFFNLLAASGVNYIRLRVWNDPFDANGKGYGGGNNDINAAIEMGKYITKAGMKVLIDFHLSDFWADPERQYAPKAWANYTADQKAAAAAEFVTESLKKLVTDNGVDVTMVQIGNETNNGVSGETDWANRNKIFDAGCDAVHAFNKSSGKNILAAVHFTDPQNEGYSMGCADKLADYDGDGDGEKEGVSYDIFASTFYPNSHGTMANITSVLNDIAKKYDKYVMVAETSWATSHKNGNDLDDSGFRTGDYVNYPVSVQGQANEIRDVANAVNSISTTLTNGEKAALGFFYWEPAWIPVQSLYDGNGELKKDAAQIVKENKILWDEFGSGWASNYAASYDEVVATWGGGGSSMTNQAVFDFDGNPLASLNVYKYLKYGAKASEVKADGYIPAEVDIEVGNKVDGVLPKITVIYTDSSQAEKEVNWNQADINTVNTKAAATTGIGTYTINGTLADDASFKVAVTVNVNPVNLLSDPGFEKEDPAWTITGEGAGITGEDPKSGSKGLHFWSDTNYKFSASTTVTVTKAGTYSAFVWVQGEYGAGTRAGESLRIKAVTADGKEFSSESVAMDGWVKWKQIKLDNIPITSSMVSNGSTTITLVIDAALNEGAWGTIDDAYLYLDKEAVMPTPGNSGSNTPVATDTPAPSNTPVPSGTPEPGDTPVPSDAPTPSDTPMNTPKPSVEPSAKPTPSSTVTVAKPKKVSVTKAKPAKKKVTVKWKKVAKADGYQVQYSTKKNLKNAKKVFVKGTSKEIKKLKSKKTYYIRIRAYKNNGSKKVYGAYSKKIKVKVK